MTSMEKMQLYKRTMMVSKFGEGLIPISRLKEKPAFTKLEINQQFAQRAVKTNVIQKDLISGSPGIKLRAQKVLIFSIFPPISRT